MRQRGAASAHQLARVSQRDCAYLARRQQAHRPEDLRRSKGAPQEGGRLVSAAVFCVHLPGAAQQQAQAMHPP